jgi:hypothetical protein
VEPHVCSCGRVCHGPEDQQPQEAEQRHSYRKSTLRQVFSKSAEVFRLLKRKELLTETAQYMPRTSLTDDEEE